MWFEKQRRYRQLDDEDDEPSSHGSRNASREFNWRCAFFVLLISFTLISVSGALWILRIQSPSKCTQYPTLSNAQEPYSPARQFVEYENRWLVGDPETQNFLGKPRKELDDAWHRLLRGTLIRVSEAELAAANATSIPLESGGYGVGLGVSHSLHCLKRIKQYFHKDYYYAEGDQDWDELENHVDHCIESLRQTLLCQVDTSLYTLVWTPHSKVKPSVRVPQPHACTNFDLLHDWMIGREASLDELIRPSDEFFEEPHYVGDSHDAVSSQDDA